MGYGWVNSIRKPIIIYNPATRQVVESMNMEFEENDESLVGQNGVCDVGDEIPSEAIRITGVGFFRPIEEPLTVDEEELCSPHGEPSPSQVHHPHEESSDANQEQDASPSHVDQG